MSQGTIIAELVAYLQEEQVVNRATYATVALVVYEHLITLRREIEMMWGTKWSMSRCLFMANRYILLLYAIRQTWPIHGLLYFWSTSPVKYVADGNIFGPLANVCGSETSTANSAQLRDCK
ncbi:hypothetical protein EIP86_000191 [Pleurotus ostreatoroseus]|nr:hypothetical protein EIP86_000191 [Pleurotus ostreatoroseus]